MLSACDSGKFIAESAKYVKIKEEGIQNLGEEIVKEINNGNLSINNFSQHQVHPKASDEWAFDWLFVVDTLNFCFWSLDKSWTINKQSGYFALCEAINRAMREKIDILNPKYYSKITREELKLILRSNSPTELRLIDERCANLHEVGKVLIEKFNGSFKNVVIAANNSAVTLLNLITEHFPCFRDVATYRGKEVSLLKRAQILVGDCWSCMRDSGLGHFPDINALTMFADYRVPQTLQHFGVFEYNDELLSKLHSNELLENGEEMEVEIRGCSIHAVELLAEYAKAKIDKGKVINSVLIDHFLWDYRRKHASELYRKQVPFHKTICIYY